MYKLYAYIYIRYYYADIDDSYGTLTVLKCTRRCSAPDCVAHETPSCYWWYIYIWMAWELHIQLIEYFSVCTALMQLGKLSENTLLGMNEHGLYLGVSQSSTRHHWFRVLCVCRIQFKYLLIFFLNILPFNWFEV